MKKRVMMILALTVILVMTLGMLCTGGASADQYKYKVMIYSGQQGHFTGSGVDSTGTVWSGEFNSGELCEISTESLGFELDNDKYYVRGFRLTGHDNDETTGVQNLTFGVTEDVSYELAYGIKGDMVSYTTRYLDQDNNELLPDDTYYGMPGDKPVVAYKYVEGYEPEAYYQAITLSENSDENVVIFRYNQIEERTETIIDRINNDNGGQNAGANANAPAAPGTMQNYRLQNRTPRVRRPPAHRQIANDNRIFAASGGAG